MAVDDLVQSSSVNASTPELLELHDYGRTSYDMRAQRDLRVISWPRRNPEPALSDLRSYAFERTGQQRSFVYVIENGVNVNAPVCKIFTKEAGFTADPWLLRNFPLCSTISEGKTGISRPLMWPKQGEMIALINMVLAWHPTQALQGMELRENPA